MQDVAVAVEFGMVAAVLLFVQDVTSSMHVRALPPSAPLLILGGGSLQLAPAATPTYGGDGAAVMGSAGDPSSTRSLDVVLDSGSDSDSEWKVASASSVRMLPATGLAPLTRVWYESERGVDRLSERGFDRLSERGYD